MRSCLRTLVQSCSRELAQIWIYGEILTTAYELPENFFWDHKNIVYLALALSSQLIQFKIAGWILAWYWSFVRNLQVFLLILKLLSEDSDDFNWNSASNSIMTIVYFSSTLYPPVSIYMYCKNDLYSSDMDSSTFPVAVGPRKTPVSSSLSARATCILCQEEQDVTLTEKAMVLTAFVQK